MKIAKYDDNIVKAMDDKTMKEFLEDKKKKHFSSIPFKLNRLPANGWAVPFVTGHKYRIHWGDTALDFERMMFEQSEQWEEGDRTIEFVSNFTDKREEVTFQDGSGHVFKNQTYAMEQPQFMQTGMNDVYNDTDTRMIKFAVSPNPRAPAKAISSASRTITMTGIRCIGGCNKAVEKKELGPPVFWSKAASWPDKKLPKEGDSVEILPGVNMFYDLPGDSPIFKLIVINGALTFNQPTKEVDLHLRV